MHGRESQAALRVSSPVTPLRGCMDLSVAELSEGIPNGKVGVTTAGEVSGAGGNVTPSPTPNNPNHCTMCGVTADQASGLMKVVPYWAAR